MLEAFLLGILQGLTEFLPVSSSGHLVYVQSMFGNISNQGLVFDVMLHAGTLLAVIIYFRNDLKRLFFSLLPVRHVDIEAKTSRRFVIGLVIATIPAGLIGGLFEDRIENMFQSPRSAALFLIITGCILFLGEFVAKKTGNRNIGFDGLSLKKCFLIGIAQSFALLPGISRSGSTISMGLIVGWTRSQATRFSFLLMIPAVAGAVVLKLPDTFYAIATHQIAIVNIAIGFISAGISGYIAVGFLIRFVKKFPLYVFGVYCLLLGSMGLVIF